MQNLPESVHDDDVVRLHAQGNVSSMSWTVGGIMRCCGIAWICVLCCLELLLLKVAVFVGSHVYMNLFGLYCLWYVIPLFIIHLFCFHQTVYCIISV
jgi:hypothetical protein